MIELNGLSFEQNKKYQYAIKCGYFDGYDDDPRAWKHSFVGYFLWRHSDRCATVKAFEDVLGHTPTWDDITDDNLRDVVDELTDGKRTLSSVRTMCAELKAVLNANKRKFKSEDYMDILSIKRQATRHVYLTHEELNRFIKYKPKTHAEAYVHRNFCVCALTGARIVDAVRMTINNCDINTGLLTYRPKKTPGIVVSVPVDERRGLRTILSKKDLSPCILPTYNELLRLICQRVGIDEESQATKNGMDVTKPKWQLVSSHTARRSFATNLWLSGIALEDIAMMMGHGKNIETTKNYICAERQMTPDIMKYFQEPREEVEYGIV